MLNQPAFGGILHQPVSLGALEFRPDPLDALIERRLKHAWQQAPCPDCGDHAVQASEDSPRIWCGNCRYTGTYTLRTPFYNSELTGGEFLIAFVLYADTLLSINQIAPLLDHAYNTVYDGIRRMEAGLSAASRPSGSASVTRSTVPHRSMRPSRYAQDSRDKIRRGKGCPAADHRRVVAPDGRGNRATN